MIQIRNLNSGSSLAVTRVQDAFNRGTLNPTGGVLTWATGIAFIGQTVTTPFAVSSFQASTGGGGGLLMTGFGQSNPAKTYEGFLYPTTFTLSKIWGLTQYCQAKIVSMTGTLGGGLAVALDPSNPTAGASDPTQCYCLFFVGNNTLRLISFQGTGSAITETDLLAPIPAVTWANGDVFRLSCTFMASANVLKTSKNGTVVNTFTDGASSLTGGIPGFFQQSVGIVGGVAGQAQFTNVDMGVGV